MSIPKASSSAVHLNFAECELSNVCDVANALSLVSHRGAPADRPTELSHGNHHRSSRHGVPPPLAAEGLGTVAQRAMAKSASRIASARRAQSGGRPPADAASSGVDPSVDVRLSLQRNQLEAVRCHWVGGPSDRSDKDVAISSSSLSKPSYAVSPLAGLNLVHLDVSYNRITSFAAFDVDGERSLNSSNGAMTMVERTHADAAGFSLIAAPSLRTLRATNNALTDLRGLWQCEELHYVDVRDNRLVSLEGLNWATFLGPRRHPPPAAGAERQSDRPHVEAVANADDGLSRVVLAGRNLLSHPVLLLPSSSAHRGGRPHRSSSAEGGDDNGSKDQAKQEPVPPSHDAQNEEFTTPRRHASLLAAGGIYPPAGIARLTLDLSHNRLATVRDLEMLAATPLVGAALRTLYLAGNPVAAAQSAAAALTGPARPPSASGRPSAPSVLAVLLPACYVEVDHEPPVDGPAQRGPSFVNQAGTTPRREAVPDRIRSNNDATAAVVQPLPPVPLSALDAHARSSQAALVAALRDAQRRADAEREENASLRREARELKRRLADVSLLQRRPQATSPQQRSANDEAPTHTAAGPTHRRQCAECREWARHCVELERENAELMSLLDALAYSARTSTPTRLHASRSSGRHRDAANAAQTKAAPVPSSPNHGDVSTDRFVGCHEYSEPTK